MKINTKTRYLNRVYDGLWRCIGTLRNGTNNNYMLQNIYNNKILLVCSKTMAKIDKGETTVSKAIYCKIKRTKFKVNKGGLK